MIKGASGNRKEWGVLGGVMLILMLPAFHHVCCFPEDIFSYLPTAIIVVTALSVLLLCLPWRIARWTIFSFLFVISLFELAHMLVYDGDISSAGYVRSLFMTTPYEADGAVGRIVTQHIIYIVLLGLLYFLVSVLIFFSKPAPPRIFRWIGLGAGVLLIVHLLCCPFKLIYRPPLNIYAQVIEAFRQRNERNRLVSMQNSFKYKAYRLGSTQKKEVYILIIDESLRYDHVSLNGESYRLTMPRMGKLDNLVSYSDYYTTGVFTMYAVPMLVTRAAPATFALNYKELGLQQAFSEVGFKSVWLTNEAQLVSDGVSDYIARGAEIIRVKRDMNMPVVVDSLCNKYDKLFIVMHLWGNHQFYLNVDAATSLYFPDVTTCSEVSGEQMYCNAYDNAILYTDSMLSALTEKLLDRRCIAQWVFLSDHGEGPIGRNGGAHGYTIPSEGEYHVPLMIWYSDEYKETYPDKVTNVLIHKDEPVSADHIFWSLLDMAGIQIDSTLRQDGMSIGSNSFSRHPRALLLPDGKSVVAISL